MRNLSEIDELLANRLAHAAKNPGNNANWGVSLRLRQGDRLNRWGWAVREVVATPGLDAGMSADDKLVLLREYWFTEWNLQEALARQKKLAAELAASRERLREQWDECGPPGKWARLDFGSFRTDSEEQRIALERVRAFPWSADQEDDDDAEFTTMALMGSTGTGKTHLAVLWLRNMVLEQGNPGQFITAAQLVREVRRAWDDRSVDESEVLERFGSMPSLVIDDIGIDTSEGAVRILVEVLDRRLTNEVQTCFTTNATARELQEILGPRGYSRLMANAQIVALTGTDQRRAGSGATLHAIPTPKQIRKQA